MRELRALAPDNHPQLLFVILPEAEGTYGTIKRVCETELGIVSQFCKPQHVMEPSKQYCENIALKINVKVGGRNSVLSASLKRRLPYVTDRPTIIFGAYVTHPSPGDVSSPSIAAVVASMDWPQVTTYKALVSTQPHRKEIIQDLYNTEGGYHGGMVRELLVSFCKSTQLKPHRIIFYRDGVSEGQSNEVLLNEMDNIRKACISMEENYMPRVTFIMVQKSHHMRFFPEKHGDKNTNDRSANILPGTVDKKICHPTEFDFYLCGHAGIQPGMQGWIKRVVLVKCRFGLGQNGVDPSLVLNCASVVAPDRPHRSMCCAAIPCCGENCEYCAGCEDCGNCVVAAATCISL